jgi:hypothetical protein
VTSLAEEVDLEYLLARAPVFVPAPILDPTVLSIHIHFPKDLAVKLV